MSKMDDLRAMREARFAESQARAKANGPAPAKPQRPPTLAVVPDPPEPAPSEPEPTGALCGHRNMGGRTCTRESGHAEKSHRYS
jgi:hypothetical protein